MDHFLFFSDLVLAVPQPENVRVDMLDGEVIVRWNRPADAPADCYYNVQMAKYVSLQNISNHFSVTVLCSPTSYYFAIQISQQSLLFPLTDYICLLFYYVIFVY